MIKQTLINHLKGIPGWRTKRKIVVISVDDYGNVRLASKAARQNIDRAGYFPVTRFDAFDTLETTNDLGALFEVLSSVKDKNGKHPIVTPFAMPCNIDFEGMRKNGFSEYVYELLPTTFSKLESLLPEHYSGTWHLWQYGISEGFLNPQFHGREHLNLKVLESNLKRRDNSTLVALENRSYTNIKNTVHPRVSYTGAFDIEIISDLEKCNGIVKDGINQFNKVFGYHPEYFNPPGAREHSGLHEALHDYGIKYMDSPLIRKQINEKGRYSYDLSYLGKKNKFGQRYLIRNVVFEPGVSGIDRSISIAWKQIQAAFRLNKPAIISSHRVNFSGLIKESNRTESLVALKRLLNLIVSNYPEVEFMPAVGLAKLIASDE